MSILNEQISPGLRKLIQILTNKTEEEQRKVLMLVCKRALQLNDVTDRRIEGGLELLEKLKYGDSPEREKLKKLIEKLDEIAWDIQDKIDAGTVNKDDYLKAFRKARAINALWFALEQDLSKAVSEAIYEANAAMDDIKELEKIVRDAIEK